MSRFRWFFVIARNSSFTYKGKAVKVRQVGRELGVRYVLKGRVRKGGNRLRITAQLIEAHTGNQSGPTGTTATLADVFACRTNCAREMVGAVKARLTPDEIDRIEGDRNR